MGLDTEALYQHGLGHGLFAKQDIVLLGGSAARGDGYNDIDLITLSRTRKPIAARVESWRGVRVEIFYHTYDGLLAAIRSEAHAGKFGKAGFILDGMPIGGVALPELARLKAGVLQLKSKGPPAFDRSHAGFFFDQRLREFESARDGAEQFAMALALANGFEQSFHLSRGEWLLTGKHFLRDLERNHPSIWHAFSTALAEGLHGNRAPLLAFMRDWVEKNCKASLRSVAIAH